jgi:phospholipid/cholesterol/gamma-HCH transport system ATP-binding protein
VAVARTLALGPEIILFDEPTVGLDPLLSTNVDKLILDLKEKVGCTNVVVTHDLITAFRVADRIGMFHDGLITALGTPEEFAHSKEPVVQEFIARNRDWKI